MSTATYLPLITWQSSSGRLEPGRERDPLPQASRDLLTLSGFRSKALIECPSVADNLTLHRRLAYKIVQRFGVFAPIVEFSAPFFVLDVLPWDAHERLYAALRRWCGFLQPRYFFHFGNRVRPIARLGSLPGQSQRRTGEPGSIIYANEIHHRGGKRRVRHRLFD